jgi:asparagine synthase (glutamine-hydrolysing)
MSVQAGIWNLDGAPIDHEALNKISCQTADYGPDGETIHLDRNIGMLYRPFHTTAESRLEHQPYVFANRKVITWDGRLDNREELISQLGSPLNARSTDVDIVAAGYEYWGCKCFASFVGDWALASWDPAENQLILARDYACMRHLYYHLTEKKAMWCTQLAPILLSAEVPFALSPEYIAGYLASYPEAQLTPYQNVRAVPGGSLVVIRDGRAVDQRFWSFQPKRRITYKTDAEYEEHFRHVFRLSVQRRLRSSSPVLAELSGGIDSSAIVCMADEIVARGEGSASCVDTLSVFDSSDPRADERTYFSEVEQIRGKTGHHLDSTKYGNFFSLDHHDFISVPGTSTHAGGLTAAISKLIQERGYRVVLSGTGGDEFLGGVPNPHPQLADLIIVPRPFRLSKQLVAWSLIKKRPLIQLFFESVLLLFPPAIRMIFADSKPAPWINAGFARRYQVAIRQSGPRGKYGFMLPSRWDCARTFVAMRRQFACSPAHSLRFEEKRYPYLDQTLIEFLLAIPASQLIRPGQRRSLMRRALAGLVPSEILLRKSKGVVARSILITFQDLWPQLEKLFASPLSGTMGYVDQSSFMQALQAAKHGDAPQLLHLLKGIYLELWLRSLNERHIVHHTESLRSRSRPYVSQTAT